MFRKLSQVRSTKAIPMFSPVVSPGSHCPMHTAVSFGSLIQGLSTLVVGSAECTVYSRGPSSRRRGAYAPEENVLNWSYMLSEDETVFGCHDGVKAAIEEMLDAGIQALMVITTCIPHMTGEDIHGLCEEIAVRRNAKVFSVDVPHYTCIATSGGTRGALTGLLGIMEERPLDAQRINVLGAFRGAALFPEMSDLLEAAGYTLLKTGTADGVKDYITAPSARMNLVVSPQALDLAIGMQERFGTAYIDLSAMLSYDDMIRGFAQLEKALGVQAPDFSDRGAEIIKLEEKVLENMRGKRFALGSGASQTPLRAAYYLAGLGMIPAVLHIDDFYPGDEAVREALLEDGYDPIVAHMVSGELDGGYINEIGVDVMIGGGSRGEDESVGFDRPIKLLNKCLGGGGKGNKYGTVSV